MGVRWVKRECVGPMGKSSHASLNWKREEAFEKANSNSNVLGGSVKVFLFKKLLIQHQRISA